MSELQFMSCEELGKWLGMSLPTVYSYTCKSKKNSRKKFNPAVYRKIGSKTIFIKNLVEEHLLNNTLVVTKA